MDMTDRERLAQRFVDQELTADERVRFVAALGRDEALRERVLALEQLAEDARRLPTSTVRAGFVEAVLARTVPVAPAPASWWRRLIDPWFTPRTVRWNLASAVAGACVVALTSAVIVWSLAPTRVGDTRADAGTAAVVLVRLVVLQPDARTVEVAGDFNGWDPGRTPLEPASGGAWTVTLPLAPGRYEYMFVVNGQEWVPDPLAVEQSDDGFGAQNAVLDVRPPRGSV
jgi:hypothetical protein